MKSEIGFKLLVAITIGSFLANFYSIFKLGSLHSEVKNLRLQVLNPTKLSPNDDPTLIAINKLSDQMANYRAEQLGRDQILGVTTNQISPIDPISPISPISQIKTLSLNKDWTKVEGYEQPSPGSKVIDYLLPNTNYEILEQRNNWYHVKIGSLTSAWVQSQFVHEDN